MNLVAIRLASIEAGDNSKSLNTRGLQDNEVKEENLDLDNPVW